MVQSEVMWAAPFQVKTEVPNAGHNTPSNNQTDRGSDVPWRCLLSLHSLQCMNQLFGSFGLGGRLHEAASKETQPFNQGRKMKTRTRATSTMTGVSRLSVLYIGMFKFWRPIRANATLLTYRIVTGAKDQARCQFTAVNWTIFIACAAQLLLNTLDPCRCSGRHHSWAAETCTAGVVSGGFCITDTGTLQPVW